MGFSQKEKNKRKTAADRGVAIMAIVAIIVVTIRATTGSTALQKRHRA
jgi:hypothetical protein